MSGAASGRGWTVRLGSLVEPAPRSLDEPSFVRTVVWVSLWTALVGGALLAGNGLAEGRRNIAVTAGAFTAIAAGLLWLGRIGRLRLAGGLLPLVSLVLLTLALDRNLGIHDSGVLCLPVIVIFAGLTLGRLGAVAFAALASGAAFWLVRPEGRRPTPAMLAAETGVGDAVAVTILLAVTTALLWVIIAGLRGSLRRAQASARALAADIEERRRVEGQREALIAELESKNAELERFNYTVSHDLRSPLVTISAFIDLAEQDARQGSEERLHSDLSVVRRAAATMRLLLEDLLELSRLGRTQLRLREVEVRQVVEEALSVLAGPIAEGRVEVTIQQGLPTVLADRARLLLLLQNLLENAIKFRDARQPEVEVGCQRRSGREVLYVQDNGVGIAPALHDKVFEVFSRLDSRIEGTGLGLALARRVVELHGGEIWVESEGAGRGARFCFTLAAAAPEPVGAGR